MNCYIMSPIDGSPIPSGINKSNALFYPEKGMTTKEQFYTLRPRDFHIVTDSPFLISLYDRKEVFFFDGEEWVNPDFQTYGTSYEIVIDRLFHYRKSIPQATYNSKECTNVMGAAILRE